MEVMVVAILIVLLFPPRELPKIARTVAQLYGQLRKTADDFRSAVLMDDELRAPIREIRSVYHDARYEIQKTRTKMQREFEDVAHDVARTSKGDDMEASLDDDSYEEESHDEEHSDEEALHPGTSADESDPLATQPKEVNSAEGSADGTLLEDQTDRQAPRPPPRRVEITAAKRAPRLRSPSGRVAQGASEELDRTPDAMESGPDVSTTEEGPAALPRIAAGGASPAPAISSGVDGDGAEVES